MLFLLKDEQGNTKFHLFKNKEYVIGRKNADIVIENDQSISRKHAIIRVGFSSVTITDCGSKYGSCHNKKKLDANKETVLKNMDVVKFGVYQSIFRFEELNVVTTSSGLTNEQKAALKNSISKIGGSYVNNWENDCNYLTAQEIVLTIKVLLAIIDDKPIVTLQYWDHYFENVQAARPPPKVENYRPPVTEALIHQVDLSANPARKTLFKDKVFVFTTEKVRKKMADLITKAGGTSISWEKSPITLSELSNTKTYLFIKNDEKDENCEPSLHKIYQHIAELGERTIPIQEVAMAIVVCSCEKDCNPKFNRIHNVFKPISTEAASEAFPLAQGTPSDDAWIDKVVPKKEEIIPESLDAEEDLFSRDIHNVLEERPVIVGFVEITKNSGSKRKENEGEENLAKKSRLEEQPVVSIIPPKQTQKSIDSDGFAIPSTSTAMPMIVSNKRKAEENLNAVAKKMNISPSSSNKITPFSLAGKRKSEENPFFAPKPAKNKKPTTVKKDPDNPFAAFRVKQEIVANADEDNPFLQLRNENNVKDTSLDEPVHEECLNISAVHIMESYIPSSSDNIPWISVTDVPKSELQLPKNPELQEIFEKFKDTVVIEVMSNRSIRAKCPFESQESVNSSCGGRKNFKKFRKVRPLRPQTTILQTSVYEDFLSDGEQDPEASFHRPGKKKGPVVMSGGEEDPEVSVSRPHKKKGPRVFDF